MKRALFLLLVACRGSDPKTIETSTPDPPKVEQKVEEPRKDGAVGSFEGVTGTRGLTPGMSVQDARRVLEDGKMSAGEHTGNARPPHWLKAKSDGWDGTLYLGDLDRSIDSIQFQSPTGDEAKAKAIVAEMEQKYGRAHSSRHVDGRDGTFKETFYVWENKSVKLEVNVHESSGTWAVFETWTKK